MVTLLGHERLAAPVTTSKPIQQSAFLTPEAMLTPGIAGALAMTIANTLDNGFGLPPSWCALVLSFVFGILVFVEHRKTSVRIVLYVLNSLVIFCMAWGTNSVGAASKDEMANLSVPQLIGPAFAGGSYQISKDDGAANAQDCANALAAVADARANGASAAEIEQLLEPCANLSNDVKSRGLTADGQSQSGSDTKRFFKPWSF